MLYSPRSQGAGLANMEAAVATLGYLTNINGKPAKGELGSSGEEATATRSTSITLETSHRAIS